MTRTGRAGHAWPELVEVACPEPVEVDCAIAVVASDSMVAIGTACNNAKKNVAAACEGKIEEDKVYKFDK